MRKTILLSSVVVFLWSTSAIAASLNPTGTWVKPVPDDMTGGNTSRLDGLSDPWYTVGVVSDDGLWDFRDPYWADNDKGFQGQDAAVLSELTTLVTGLDDSRIYEIRILYWNWAGGVSARLHGETDYGQFNGSVGTSLVSEFPANDNAYETVIGTVSGVSSYQIDVEDYSGWVANRYIGTSYLDIGPVPEPGSVVMFVTGLLCLLGVRALRRWIA